MEISVEMICRIAAIGEKGIREVHACITWQIEDWTRKETVLVNAVSIWARRQASSRNRAWANQFNMGHQMSITPKIAGES